MARNCEKFSAMLPKHWVFLLNFWDFPKTFSEFFGNFADLSRKFGKIRISSGPTSRKSKGLLKFSRNFRISPDGKIVQLRGIFAIFPKTFFKAAILPSASFFSSGIFRLRRRAAFLRGKTRKFGARYSFWTCQFLKGGRGPVGFFFLPGSIPYGIVRNARNFTETSPSLGFPSKFSEENRWIWRNFRGFFPILPKTFPRKFRVFYEFKSPLIS